MALTGRYLTRPEDQKEELTMQIRRNTVLGHSFETEATG